MKYIFQITRRKPEGWWYTYNHLNDNVNAFGYELATGVKREDAINYLMSYLRMGMFTLSEDRTTLTYNGGVEDWKREMVEMIRSITEGSATTDEKYNLIVNFGEDPLNADAMFYVDDVIYQTGGVIGSKEMVDDFGGLEVGDKLYIGEIVEKMPPVQQNVVKAKSRL